MRNTNKPPYAATEIPKKRLTPKQLEVFIYRIEGWTQQKISDYLDISRSAVQGHMRAIRKKGFNLP